MKRRSTIAIVSAIAIGTVAVAVTMWSGSPTYDPDEIKVLAQGHTADGYQLEFAIPNDPGFHCPGVNFRRDGSRVHFTYVRARVDESPDVDLPLIKAYSGNDAVVFPYPEEWPSPGASIELIDENDRSLGRSTAHGKHQTTFSYRLFLAKWARRPVGTSRLAAKPGTSVTLGCP